MIRRQPDDVNVSHYLLCPSNCKIGHTVSEKNNLHFLYRKSVLLSPQLVRLLHPMLSQVIKRNQISFPTRYLIVFVLTQHIHIQRALTLLRLSNLCTHIFIQPARCGSASTLPTFLPRSVLPTPPFASPPVRNARACVRVRNSIYRRNCSGGI